MKDLGEAKKVVGMEIELDTKRVLAEGTSEVQHRR